MVVSVLDPSGAETLRQNREVLSVNITNLINEYGPKAFPDFDGKGFYWNATDKESDANPLVHYS